MSDERLEVIGVEGFAPLVGTHVGYSQWRTIEQERIDAFADATSDRQWIHVDTDRARTGPFGTTIAHGYLVLSLGPVLLREVWTVRDVSMGVNYGADKIRFPSPTPVGSRLRCGVEVVKVDEVSGGVQVTLRQSFEVDGAAKPSCVADVIYRYFR